MLLTSTDPQCLPDQAPQPYPPAPAEPAQGTQHPPQPLYFAGNYQGAQHPPQPLYFASNYQGYVHQPAQDMGGAPAAASAAVANVAVPPADIAADAPVGADSSLHPPYLPLLYALYTPGQHAYNHNPPPTDQLLWRQQQRREYPKLLLPQDEGLKKEGDLYAEDSAVAYPPQGELLHYQPGMSSYYGQQSLAGTVGSNGLPTPGYLSGSGSSVPLVGQMSGQAPGQAPGHAPQLGQAATPNTLTPTSLATATPPVAANSALQTAPMGNGYRDQYGAFPNARLQGHQTQAMGTPQFHMAGYMGRVPSYDSRVRVNSTPVLPVMGQGRPYEAQEEAFNVPHAVGLKRNQCPVCHKVFKRPLLFQIHFSIHTGVKLYKCEWEGCGRLFNVKSNMTRHYKLHLRHDN